MFEETRSYLEKLGLPGSDLWDLPTSGATFSDGAHFRIEVPTINTADAAAALVKRAEELGIQINRITETYGMFRHTRDEIKDYVAIAKGHGAELVMATGPRATYDTSATVLSPQGVRISYRLRGVEQLVRAIEDIKRGVELGVRGFLIYDEGMLWVVTQMRKDGELPSDVFFKVSAHCGHSNPAAFRILAEMGADSINPVRDLQLPMIAALRAAISTPIDCHTDNPPASGGFIRTYEAPEIARLASPVHLKTGNSVLAGHGQMLTAENARRMAEQASLVLEMVNRYYPEGKQSGKQ
ncbi:MAG TPA: peptidase [Anaerolineae bacterium]|nr:peptidase [Anaerolineae bacterium]